MLSNVVLHLIDLEKNILNIIHNTYINRIEHNLHF